MHAAAPARENARMERSEAARGPGTPLPAGAGDGALLVYGTEWCVDCHRARALLDRAGVAYAWIDIEHDEAAAARVLEINGGLRSVPTILFPDGRCLVEPSGAELLAALARPAGGAG